MRESTSEMGKPSETTPGTLPEFKNEPLTDFSKEANAAAMRQALAKVSSELGRTHSIVIGGRVMEGDGTFDSTNPSRPDQVVGRFAKGTAEQADLAVRAAFEAFGPWSRRPARERADLLFRAAEIVRGRKHEMSAWM